ncbi:MAG TPA: hypothetical protein ACQGQI_06930, partial [Xylella sp.]
VAYTPHYSVNTPFNNESVKATPVTPASTAIYHKRITFGTSSEILSQHDNSKYLVDPLLLRLRVNGKQNIAKAVSIENPTKLNNKTDYKQQTIYDNTPWRFNMSQEGKRMTADQFDEWMKARGVHVIPSQPNTNVESVSEAK